MVYEIFIHSYIPSCEGCLPEYDENSYHSLKIRDIIYVYIQRLYICYIISSSQRPMEIKIISMMQKETYVSEKLKNLSRSDSKVAELGLKRSCH